MVSTISPFDVSGACVISCEGETPNLTWFKPFLQMSFREYPGLKPWATANEVEDLDADSDTILWLLLLDDLGKRRLG